MQLSQLMEVEKKEKPKKKKKKKKKRYEEAELLAKESIREHGVASETLAWLLEKQGHQQKAIDMYRLLVIQKPEKADYFREKIRQLEES